MDLSVSELMLAFLHDRSFAGRTANALPHVSCPGLGTLAIGIHNKRICLFTDPEFIAKVSLPLGHFAMEHEVLGHFSSAHIPRFLEFLAHYPKPEDRERIANIMNIAADCAANSMLRRSKHFAVADKEMLDFARWKYPDVVIPDDTAGGMILPERYDMEVDKSFEHYMHVLMNRTGLNGGARTLEHEAAYEALVEIIKQLGKSHSKWPGFEDLKTMSPDELHSLAHQLHNQTKHTLRKIVKEMRQQGRGTMPGSFSEMLDDYLAESIVPWWEIFTSRIVTSKRTKTDRGVQRPNRTLLAMAEEDPEILPAIGITQDATWRIFFVEDTSGSMSKETIAIGRNELQNMLSLDEDMEVRWIQFDTQATFDQLFHHGDELPRDAIGRGGTDFDGALEHIWKYMESHDTAPDLVVIYTDGGAPAVRPELWLPPEVPVIWCVTHPHAGDHLTKAGFGEVIVCDESQTEMYEK